MLVLEKGRSYKGLVVISGDGLGGGAQLLVFHLVGWGELALAEVKRQAMHY